MVIKLKFVYSVLIPVILNILIWFKFRPLSLFTLACYKLSMLLHMDDNKYFKQAI